MNIRITGQFGLGTLVTALIFGAIAAAGTLFAAKKLEVPQQYSDFIVGNISWNAVNKSWDYLAIVAFFLIFGVALTGTWLVGRLLNGDSDNNVGAAALDRALLFSLIPGVFSLGAMLAKEPLTLGFPALSGVGILICFVSALMMARFRRQLANDDAATIFGEILLSAFFALMAGLALLTMVGRVSPTLHSRVLAAIQPWKIMSAQLKLLTIGSFCFSGVFVWVFTARSVVILKRRLARFLLLMQLPTPLLWFVLIPPFAFDGAGFHYLYRPSVWLYGLILVIIAVSLITWITIWFKHCRFLDSFSLNNLITPASLSAILIYIRTPSLGLTVYSGDDYHMGEKFIPWQQLISFGKMPFVDINYPRGFVNLLIGCINSIFFDGSAAAFPYAEIILFALILTITLCALLLYLPPLPSFMLALIAVQPIYNHLGPHFLLVFPALLFLVWPPLRERPRVWLIVWGGTSYLLVLYMITTGTAFVLATLPLTAWTIFQSYRSNTRSLLLFLLVVTLLVGLFLLTTPLGSVTSGILRFILENSAVNTTAYGIVWNAIPRLDVIRFGWIIGLLLLVAIVLRELQQSPETRDKVVLVGASILVIFSLSLMSYSFGRIDGSLSRTGMYSLWLAGAGLPFLACRIANRSWWPYLFLVFAFMGGGASRLTEASTGDGTKLFQHPFREISLSKKEQGLLANNPDLPRLGAMILNDTYRNRLFGLREELSSLLRPGETYLDFTNRSALYYFLDLPVPALEAAVYNAPSTKTQKRMLAQLSKSPPPIVLAWGDATLHDGGSISLRNYLLYRHFALSYVPVKRGRFIFLVRPDRAKGLQVLRESDSIPLAQGENDIWINGFPKNHEKSEIRIDDPIHLLGVEPGDTVIFPDGSDRKIIAVQGSVVKLDAFPSDMTKVNKMITVTVNRKNLMRRGITSQEDETIRRKLLIAAFHQKVLHKLPVAWGRSLEGLKPSLSSTGKVSGQWQSVTADDGASTVTIPTDRLNLRGSDTALLKTRFNCTSGNKAHPLDITLSWTQEKTDISENEQSIRFTAENGTLLIPLDSNPSWLSVTKPVILSLRSQKGADCTRFNLEDLEFYKRN